MRAYQEEAVAAAVLGGREGHITALEMGLGKTRVAITAMFGWKGPAVVVMPAHIRGVWQDELKKWWPGVRVFDARGTKPPAALPDCDVVLCNYDILYAWQPLLSACCKAMVADEVHILVDGGSRRGKAVKALAESCTYKLGLTGTPLTGALKALYNVVDTLSPGRFGSFFNYGRRYCAGHQITITTHADGPKAVWDFSGRSNEAELAARLKHFMFRRTREEVALELPPKTRQIIRLDNPTGFKLDLSALTPDVLRRALVAAADVKMPEVMRVVQGHAEAGHKVVVFTYRRAVAEMVTRELVSAGVDAAYIHGGLTEKQRATIQTAPPSVLACTIDAVATGINWLTFADVAVFAELSYEPWKLRQAEARLHRSGQSKPVLVQYVVGKGGIEDMVLDAILEKLDTEADVVGAPDASLATDLRGAAETEAEAFANIFAQLGQSA